MHKNARIYNLILCESINLNPTFYNYAKGSGRTEIGRKNAQKCAYLQSNFVRIYLNLNPTFYNYAKGSGRTEIGRKNAQKCANLQSNGACLGFYINLQNLLESRLIYKNYQTLGLIYCEHIYVFFL